QGATYLVIGVLCAAIGTVLLAFMGVHLLLWLIPSWPTWVGYAVVGGGILLSGAIAAYAGVTKFRHLNLRPDNALQALKENMQWTMTPTASDNKCAKPV